MVKYFFQEYYLYPFTFDVFGHITIISVKTTENDDDR